jgi:hypothetical protein
MSKCSLDSADYCSMLKLSLEFCPVSSSSSKRAFAVCVYFNVSLNSHTWQTISSLYSFVGQALVVVSTNHTIKFCVCVYLRVQYWYSLGKAGFFPHDIYDVCTIPDI